MSWGRLLPSFLALLLSPLATCWAEEFLTREMIVEQLTPDVRTRGLVLVEAAPTVAFGNINFEFDSAVLTHDARVQVEEIAAALQDASLQTYRFEVAGHADARGSDAYNLALSRARAEAVVRELERLGVDGERLHSSGWGKRRPLAGMAPEDRRQRRVEVVNLGR
jgi:outer membrane protein OmpA-like peptidoglycan-associated protein